MFDKPNTRKQLVKTYQGEDFGVVISGLLIPLMFYPIPTHLRTKWNKQEIKMYNNPARIQVVNHLTLLSHPSHPRTKWNQQKIKKYTELETVIKRLFDRPDTKFQASLLECKILVEYLCEWWELSLNACFMKLDMTSPNFMLRELCFDILIHWITESILSFLAWNIQSVSFLFITFPSS